MPVPWMSNRASAVGVRGGGSSLGVLLLMLLLRRGGGEDEEDEEEGWEMMMWGFRLRKPPVLKDLMYSGGNVAGESSVEDRSWVEGEVWRRV